MEDRKYVSTTIIANTRKSALTVFLESWGEQDSIEPGEQLWYTFESEQAGHVHIEVSDEDVTVFGWTGSFVTVTKK